MSCITLVMQPTMATTRLVRPICSVGPIVEPTLTMVERPQLNMSWVVVTGENGRRQLRMAGLRIKGIEVSVRRRGPARH
jgi:hypothetical protein